MDVGKEDFDLAPSAQEFCNLDDADKVANMRATCGSRTYVK